MADIPGSANKIQTEETQFRAPVSEATLTRIGASINFLLDKIPFTVTRVDILSSGTYIAPSNVRFAIVEGCGGGGGGAGSIGSSVGVSDYGGGGGGSGGFYSYHFNMTPNASYTVVIGSGGLGGGVNQFGYNGGNTTFGNLIWPGGRGGGKQVSPTVQPKGGQPNLTRMPFFYCAGADGGDKNMAPNPPGGIFFSNLGGQSLIHSDPAAGSGGSGGGGAGGPYGPGGNGGHPGSNFNFAPQAGFSATPNSGAGGGGAGGKSVLNPSGTANVGGAGGSGRVVLWLFTAD